MDFGNLAGALAQRLGQAAQGYTGGLVAADQAKRQMAEVDATRRFQAALLGYRENAISGRADARSAAADARLKIQQDREDARQQHQLDNAVRLEHMRRATQGGKPITQAQVNLLVGNYIESTFAQNDQDAKSLEDEAATEPDPNRANALRAQAAKLRAPLTVATMAQQAFAQDAALDPSTAPLLRSPMTAVTFKAQAQRLLTKRDPFAGLGWLMGSGPSGSPAPSPVPAPGPTVQQPPAPAGAGPIINAPPPAPAPRAPAPQPDGNVQPPASSLFQVTPKDVQRAATDTSFAKFLKSMGWNGQHAAVDPADSTAPPPGT